MPKSSLKKSDEPAWRITKLRIVECSLVDAPANDMATIESIQLAKRYDGEVVKKYSPEFKKYMISKGFGYLVGEPEDPLGFLKASNYPVDAAINPATGTNTASRGPGPQFGSATPEAMAEIDAVERFVEELTIAITELGASNESANLSPAEVLARAAKIARSRMLDITDRSADTGADPSLNPTSPGARATADRRESADSDDFNNLFSAPSGFELAKRMWAGADDQGLIAKMSRSDRVSVGGLSSSLLKGDEADMRKVEAGRGDADTGHIIREPAELAKRLSARDDVRKTIDFSALTRGADVPAWHGSSSPGILGDGVVDTLAKRLKNIRPTTIEDLLH